MRVLEQGRSQVLGWDGKCTYECGLRTNVYKPHFHALCPQFYIYKSISIYIVLHKLSLTQAMVEKLWLYDKCYFINSITKIHS